MGYSKSPLLVVLLMSMAWLAPTWGEDKDAEVEEGVVEEEEDVVSDELLEEEDVLVLHQHNFERALHEHRLLLVEFCKLGGRGETQLRPGRGCQQQHGPYPQPAAQLGSQQTLCTAAE